MNPSSECKNVVGVAYSISGLMHLSFTAFSPWSNFRPGKLRYMLSFSSIVKSAGTMISNSDMHAGFYIPFLERLLELRPGL